MLTPPQPPATGTHLRLVRIRLIRQTRKGMSQYLSQNRIEEPVWLEPTEFSFLRKRISETEAQVESLEAHVFELRHQIDTKLGEIASFRNVLSAVRRIPVEILSEIFELSRLPGDGILRPNHVIVALATPRLWSKICFYDRMMKVLTNVDSEWVEKWVNRSRNHLLDAYLSLNRDVSAQFLERILKCRQRIRTLDVAGHPKSYTALFNLPQSSFSQLEQVNLSIERRDGYPFPNKIQAFSDAPKLHHVQIRGGTTDHVKIAESESTISDAAVYIDTLHACKNLVNLEINLPVRRGLTSNISILLPALKSLKMYCFHNRRFDDLLCRLTLPLLECLTLSGYYRTSQHGKLASLREDWILYRLLSHEVELGFWARNLYNESV
ncbi:hypothetical protein BT96DRAFT_1012168 [Gymnopus androsaceus JB14]|uniref:F-box domain-containing protein n=1 Tax=Gymnopus androsaceus JB14 TaxID=1447944 RepID=A0A6A4IL10_9AGAR|nr:hypothetical protein BT96DRAFT_1012168 [Gymnopus androsaceus JB14]